VLRAAGYAVNFPRAEDAHPLCCGRTFLASGLVDEAKAEARRMVAALLPYVTRGVPVIGLEPSCLLGLRDEFLSMLPGAAAGELALNALLFEEFIARELDAERFTLKLKPLPQKKALLHGHCHQKAFAVMPAVQRTLELVPELEVDAVESSCCGMAGSFGYEGGHYQGSLKMAGAALLPPRRSARAGTLLAARCTSRPPPVSDRA